MGFLGGFLAGFFIGIITMAIMVAGSDADDRMEEFFKDDCFKEKDDADERIAS